MIAALEACAVLVHVAVPGERDDFHQGEAMSAGPREDEAAGAFRQPLTAEAWENRLAEIPGEGFNVVEIFGAEA
jgi:hypothetical protein